MVITASAGLEIAKENLKLALKQPEDTEAYRKYVESLRWQVKKWTVEVENERKRHHQQPR